MVIPERAKIKDGAIVFGRPLALPDGKDVDVSIQIAGAPADIEPLDSAEKVEDLASLPFFGMWRDRDAIADSAEWVNRQRDYWNRYPEAAE
jgi:hypothetical protein